MNATERKTTKTVIAEHPDFARLIRAVVATVGPDYLADIAQYGAAAGFSGITYCTDTVAFFRRHRKQIVALVESEADSFGVPAIEMVRGFRCLSNPPESAIARCLYGGRITDDDDITLVANALAWFACETVAYWHGA